MKNYKIADIVSRIRLYFKMIDETYEEDNQLKRYYINGLLFGYVNALRDNDVITRSSCSRLNKIISNY